MYNFFMFYKRIKPHNDRSLLQRSFLFFFSTTLEKFNKKSWYIVNSVFACGISSDAILFSPLCLCMFAF